MGIVYIRYHTIPLEVSAKRCWFVRWCDGTKCHILSIFMIKGKWLSFLNLNGSNIVACNRNSYYWVLQAMLSNTVKNLECPVVILRTWSMGKCPVMMQRDTNTNNAQQYQQNRNPTFEASTPFLVFRFLICFRWRRTFWCVLWSICWLVIPWARGRVHVVVNFSTTYYSNSFSSSFSQYLIINFRIH